jgi:hypothetical protein
MLGGGYRDLYGIVGGGSGAGGGEELVGELVYGRMLKMLQSEFSLLILNEQYGRCIKN